MCSSWKSRHWTLPFQGERYSLVWFTPSGVSLDELYWLNEIEKEIEQEKILQSNKRNINKI
jgi:hypothetical protein